MCTVVFTSKEERLPQFRIRDVIGTISLVRSFCSFFANVNNGRKPWVSRAIRFDVQVDPLARSKHSNYGVELGAPVPIRELRAETCLRARKHWRVIIREHQWLSAHRPRPILPSKLIHSGLRGRVAPTASVRPSVCFGKDKFFGRCSRDESADAASSVTWNKWVYLCPQFIRIAALRW